MAQGATYPVTILRSDGSEVRITGELNYSDSTNQPASATDASVVWLTVQASAPSPLTTFITPLVFNSTASTGGLYSWTGTTYSKIGLATS